MDGIKGKEKALSFKKPYQKSKGKTVHRASRKAKFSATVGYLKGNKNYLKSKSNGNGNGNGNGSQDK